MPDFYGVLSDQPDGPGDRLKQLAPVGSTLRLRTFNRDRFGRLIAEVFHAGKNVNLQLVREG